MRAPHPKVVDKIGAVSLACMSGSAPESTGSSATRAKKGKQEGSDIGKRPISGMNCDKALTREKSVLFLTISKPCGTWYSRIYLTAVVRHQNK